MKNILIIILVLSFSIGCKRQFTLNKKVSQITINEKLSEERFKYSPGFFTNLIEPVKKYNNLNDYFNWLKEKKEISRLRIFPIKPTQYEIFILFDAEEWQNNLHFILIDNIIHLENIQRASIYKGSFGPVKYPTKKSNE